MIFDIEGNGLFPTKIYVMAYQDGDQVKYTHDYDEMRDLLSKEKLLIGHNIIGFDIPVLERILEIKIKAKLIDTLVLSWYIMPNRLKHGLDSYGEEAGIPKPKIDDWHNLTPQEYAHRCVEDVKINQYVFSKLMSKLEAVYEGKSTKRIINYLMFKAKCLRLQQESKWKLDYEMVLKELPKLRKEYEYKVAKLKQAMPSVPVYTTKTRPAKPYKKDGTLSVIGAKWFNLLKEHNLPEDYNGEIQVLVREDEPNPGSNPQIKDWLFSMGWKPQSFKFTKDAQDNEKSIPQVRVEGDEGKELCPSVLRLAKDNPIINELEGMTVLNHRIGILTGFLENMDENGYLIAEAAGLTNTLRFKHRTIVNLPGVNKPYGEIIRGALIAREGYELCGSDMTSLESNTKKHYMFPHDPDYVAEMSKPGFDEHLDLAKVAGKVTQEQIDQYVAGELPELKPIRTKFKPVNYAGVYGVGKKTLSRSSGMSEKECADLLKIYWERNWAVKKVAEETITKTLNGEMWLWNPVSEFWYSLRYEKDIFSTLNQGTGVYCFDCWIQEILKLRPQLTAQFHDEIVLEIKKGYRDKCKKLLKSSIDKVNKKLKLNILLDVDVQFGNSYADIH